MPKPNDPNWARIGPHGAFEVSTDPSDAEGEGPHTFKNTLLRVTGDGGTIVLTGMELLYLAAWATSQIAKE